MDGTCNTEQEMKDRGSLYEKTPMPCTSNVEVDGRLPNGAKRPRSAKARVKQVAALIAALRFVPKAIRLTPDNADLSPGATSALPQAPA